MPKRMYKFKPKDKSNKKRKIVKKKGKKSKEDMVYYDLLGKDKDNVDNNSDDDSDNDSGSDVDDDVENGDNENSVWNIYKKDEENDIKNKKVDTYNNLIQSLIYKVGSNLSKDKRSLIKQVQEEKGYDILSSDNDENSETNGGEFFDEENNDNEDDDDDSDNNNSNDDDDDENENGSNENENEDEEKQKNDIFVSDDAEEEIDDDDDDDESKDSKEKNEIINDNDPFIRRFSSQMILDEETVKLVKMKIPYSTREKEDFGTFELSDQDYNDTGVLKVSRTLTGSGRNKISKEKFDILSKSNLSFQPFLSPKLLERWKVYTKARISSNHNSDSYPYDSNGYSDIHKNILPVIMGYYDVYNTTRTIHNAPMIRESYTLHILNHVLKSVNIKKKNSKILVRERIETGKKVRAKVVQEVLKQEKNDNKKLGNISGINDIKHKAEEKFSNLEDECKDQGFSRPKVLIIVPFRNSVLRIVKLMCELLASNVKKAHYEEFIQRYGTGDENLDDLSSSKSYDEIDFVKNNHPLQKQVPAKGERIVKRPSDWNASFEGNCDESFCLGISMSSDKFICFGSELYASDIIIASPLGLRLEIGNSVREGFSGFVDRDRENKVKTSKTENGKKLFECNSAAFLSSIEICVIDEADVYDMQNRQHLIDAMAMLNRFPTKPRKDTDFSRVYPFALAKQSLYFRQTLIFSSYKEAYMNALAQRGLGLVNFSGMVQMSELEYDSIISSKIIEKKKFLQRFIKVSKIDDDLPSDSVNLIPSAADDIDEIRFNFFKQKVMPSLEDPETAQGTLLFIPSYLDFVRVRNLFNKRANEIADLEFGAITRIKKQERQKAIAKKLEKSLSDKAKLRRKRNEKRNEMFSSICEYTSYEDVSFARNEFFHGNARVLIITERWLFYNRYRIRGIKKIILYSPPIHASYYKELILSIGDLESNESTKKIPIITLISPLQNSLELQRILGTSQATKFLLDENKFSLSL